MKRKTKKIGPNMNLFKKLKNHIHAFLSIKSDDNEQGAFTVTCDESVKLSALPDLLPKKDSLWNAATDLGRFRVLDTYSDSGEVLVQEVETDCTFVMHIDVFDLLFSVQVQEEEKSK